MRVTLDISESEFSRLQRLAEAERRPVKHQASWLLSKALNQETDQEDEKRIDAKAASDREAR
jgi:hypothetical protein